MSEGVLTALAIPKLALVSLYAYCYSVGGRNWGLRYVRRLLAPAILSFGCISLLILTGELNWKALSLLALFPPLFMGYGSDNITTKYIRRFLYGTAHGLSALLISLLYGEFLLGAFQLCLSIVSSLYFGVLNPEDTAVDEEVIVGILTAILIPFIVI